MPASPGPTVSVVVPTYNCGRYLSAALDSALCQTLPPQQVIVVDDGSTDDTPARCAAYGGRITYLRQENRGAAAARNVALGIATGDYVALQDADDVCAPERFARQVAALRARPGAVACFTGVWMFVDDGGVLRRRPADPRDEVRPALDYLWYHLVDPMTALFDRRAAAGILFPQGLEFGEDRVFTARLRGRGGFVLLPDVLYGYRRWGGQVTGRFSEIEGYLTLLSWARGHAAAVWPDASPREVEDAMLRCMAHYTAEHYWTRRREAFLCLRGYLRANWPGHMPRHPVLRWRWYPDWLWRAKGRLDRLRRPRPAPVPQTRPGATPRPVSPQRAPAPAGSEVCHG